MELHESQKTILSALKKEPNMSIRQLQKTVGLNCYATAEYHVKALMAKGLLVKNVKWLVIEDRN